MHIGINLSRPAEWIKPIPFIDLVKLSGPWQAQYPKTYAGEREAISLNSAGWPAAIPSGATRLVCSLPEQAGRFRVDHGRNVCKLNFGATVVEKGDGWFVCDVADVGQQQLVVTVPTGEPVDLTLKVRQLSMYKATL